MQLEVIGVKAKSTEDAKWQDMKSFMTWYSDANGHLLAENWLKRDTAGYLDSLEALGRKPATINRAFRTIRTFVRWMQKRPHSAFETYPGLRRRQPPLELQCKPQSHMHQSELGTHVIRKLVEGQTPLESRIAHAVGSWEQ